MSPRLHRVAGALLCLTALFSTGCPGESAPLVAGVDGAHDLAVLENLLFITATDDNELRVVDLSLERPDFVRAPNPLHPLSIPVAVRPVELAHDVTWTDGIARGGHFVYARSATGQEISVVDSIALRELAQRVTLGDTAGTFTALAARLDPGADASTLYYAVSRVVAGRPAGSLRSRTISHAGVVGSETVLHEVDCGAIGSIVVLPEANQLAFSVRRLPAALDRCVTAPTEAERLAALDLLASQHAFLFDTATRVQTVLDFGAPIRRLYTHNAYGGIPAATRIYGLVDEDACARPGCQGVLAVDHAARSLVQLDGRPMRPLSPQGPLPMGLALGENGNVAWAVPVNLLGVIPAADGQLYFFDADALRLQDLEPEGPSVELLGSNHPGAGGGPIVHFLQDGAVRNEEVTLAYRGALPGFGAVQAPEVPSAFVDVPRDPTLVVEVGDVVETPPECGGSLASPPTVQAVERRSVLGGRLTLGAPVGGPGCTFALRPPPEGTPWVVSGTRSGFLGRVAPRAAEDEPSYQLPVPERREAQYFHFPPGLPPAPEPLPPAFHFQLVEPEGGPMPDHRFLLRTRSGFVPAAAQVDARAGARLNLGVAGAAQFRPGNADRLVVSFPSGDVVLQLYPREVAPGAPITRFDTFQ